MSSDKLGEFEMKTRTTETSHLIYVRLAGFLYLLTVPLGAFTLMYVPSSLIVSGDAATTASNRLLNRYSIPALSAIYSPR